MKRMNTIYFCLGTALSAAVGFHLYTVIEKTDQTNAERISTIYTERTESLINSIFHKTDVLAAVVKLDQGNIDEATFNAVAKIVYEPDSGIRGIQYMPGAVVTYSYPIEGNEAVMGKNFFEIPERVKDVMLAINTKSIALSGPYELIQGGLGVVARNPVFLTDSFGEEHFFGFSAIVLDLPDALAGAQLERLPDTGYTYQLYCINENNERIIISGDHNLDTDKAICTAVKVPNHEWTLAIKYNDSWKSGVAGFGIFAVCMLMMLVIGNILRLVDREKKAIAAKDEFFSNISHDMRTPLNAVLGFTKLAQGDSISAEMKDEYLAKISSSGNLLLELVNDTLLLSKGSSGKLKIHEEPHPIYAMSREVWNSVAELAKQKGIELIPEYSHCQDYTILTDSLYVEKIFLNLITNAIKYTPAGGHVWLTAKTEPAAENQVSFVFTIKDDGIGMSEEFQAHMYEPFVQENRTGYESNGTGLGLAIVKQTVDLLHGTIQVQSRINEGTEFTIHLHFTLAPVQETSAQRMSRTDIKALAGKKILVCEDNAMNREIAVSILKNAGMEAVTAADGQQGLQIFEASQDNEFAAILMDRRMPVMDGLEAAANIRRIKRKDAQTIPIIAMTADVFDEDIKECLAAGMDAHIAKPIDTEKMYSILDQWINRQR